MTQAGVIFTNWIAIATEIKHDEDHPLTPGMNKAFGEHMGLYDFQRRHCQGASRREGITVKIINSAGEGAKSMSTQPSASATELNQALLWLLNEQAILTQIARFDDAIIRKDKEAFRQLWVEDGVWEIGQLNPDRSKNISPLHAEGIEQILAAQEQFNNVNEFFFRGTLRSVIEVIGDRATARSPNVEFARRRDGHGYSNVAMYEDVLVRRNGAWLFSSRRYYYIWVDSTSPITGGDAVALPEANVEG